MFSIKNVFLFFFISDLLIVCMGFGSHILEDYISGAFFFWEDEDTNTLIRNCSVFLLGVFLPVVSI